MRSVIVVWGAHGSGKTTLAQWVEASCPKALVIYGDTDKEWKGLQETKRKNILQLMRHLEAEPRHVLFEGMRFPTGVLPTFIEYANLTPDVRFVLLVGLSTPARMLETMKRRKAARGREWSAKVEDYWRPAKLEYESAARFMNAVTKLKPSIRTKQFRLVWVHLNDDPDDFSSWDQAKLLIQRWMEECPN